MTDREKIAQIYDHGVTEEYERLVRTPMHQAEFELTADLLLEYVSPGSSVLDIGAGPGRYSELLMEKLDCQVALVDLSEESLRHFRNRTHDKYGDKVLLTRKACATDLSWVEDSSFDVVLLMGPLYHLINESERQSAIEQCRRVLKPGGLVFAAFLSPYASYVRLLSNSAEQLMNPAHVERLVNLGITEHTIEGITVEQYRCWPNQAVRMMEDGGFNTVRVRNLEGIGAFMGESDERALENTVKKQAWFNLLRKTCEIPELLGATLHFLYVGKR